VTTWSSINRSDSLPLRVPCPRASTSSRLAGSGAADRAASAVDYLRMRQDMRKEAKKRSRGSATGTDAYHTLAPCSANRCVVAAIEPHEFPHAATLDDVPRSSTAIWSAMRTVETVAEMRIVIRSLAELAEVLRKYRLSVAASHRGGRLIQHRMSRACA